jgi:peptide/nickel transport system ATP-binding protein
MTTGNKILFSVNDLRVTYQKAGGKKHEAVKGVSFDLRLGETLGIVGESGSGKSTIAKALMLLQESSGGKILFKDEDIALFSSARKKQYRREVQMVFQDATGSLNPRMTIRSMLREVLLHQGDVEKSSVDERIKELLNLTGLADAILDRYPRELSGGQCQRASFARALAAHPQVLVADEPVSALDVSVQARILNLMRDLRHQLNLSIILIAHDLAVVRNVCDKVAVMHKGEFVDLGTAEEVFANPKSDYTKRLLDAVPDVDRSLKNIKTKVHYEES